MINNFRHNVDNYERVDIIQSLLTVFELRNKQPRAWNFPVDKSRELSIVFGKMTKTVNYFLKKVDRIWFKISPYIKGTKRSTDNTKKSIVCLDLLKDVYDFWKQFWHISYTSSFYFKNIFLKWQKWYFPRNKYLLIRILYGLTKCLEKLTSLGHELSTLNASISIVKLMSL